VDNANDSWLVCSGGVCPIEEQCNGIDDDCDGKLAGADAPKTLADINNAIPFDERDHDGDNYLACRCDPGIKLADGKSGCDDCNDLNPAIHPGARELCNNVDDDCNPATPDGSGECTGAKTSVCCSLELSCRDLTRFVECATCGNACDPVRANACAPDGCKCGSALPCAGANYCASGNCAPCNTSMYCGPTCTACGAGTVCKSDGSGCTGCNNDNDCSVSSYCALDGTCKARVLQGSACNVDPLGDCRVAGCRECSAGLFCTDHVCCNMGPAQCGGCLQCTAPSGTCNNVPANNDPHNVCPPAGGDDCQSNDCNGAGSCARPNGVPCGATSCINGMITTHSCVNGVCSGVINTGCPGGFACANDTTCSSGTCTSSSQCAVGNCCNGSTCGPNDDAKHCGSNCVDCTVPPIVLGKACVSNGAICGCASIADCDTTTPRADGCTQIGPTGPKLCSCGSGAACPGPQKCVAGGCRCAPVGLAKHASRSRRRVRSLETDMVCQVTRSETCVPRVGALEKPK
jgi:hypothetical protein